MVKNGNRKTGKTTLETSGEDVFLHSKRVENMVITLETSEENVFLHSKRVKFLPSGVLRSKTNCSFLGYLSSIFLIDFTLQKTTLETGGKQVELHSKRVEKK